MTAVTAFGRQRFDAQIRFLLACLYYQKYLKMKIIMKKGLNFYSKVFTQKKLVPKNKALLLK